jgi:hypothetical protein
MGLFHYRSQAEAIAYYRLVIRGAIMRMQQTTAKNVSLSELEDLGATPLAPPQSDEMTRSDEQNSPDDILWTKTAEFAPHHRQILWLLWQGMDGRGLLSHEVASAFNDGTWIHWTSDWPPRTDVTVFREALTNAASRSPTGTFTAEWVRQNRRRLLERLRKCWFDE